MNYEILDMAPALGGLRIFLVVYDWLNKDLCCFFFSLFQRSLIRFYFTILN